VQGRAAAVGRLLKLKILINSIAFSHSPVTPRERDTVEIISQKRRALSHYFIFH
jgi:hypothetical protein